jgi:hypothetical protein
MGGDLAGRKSGPRGARVKIHGVIEGVVEQQGLVFPLEQAARIHFSALYIGLRIGDEEESQKQ